MKSIVVNKRGRLLLDSILFFHLLSLTSEGDRFGRIQGLLLWLVLRLLDLHGSARHLFGSFLSALLCRQQVPCLALAIVVGEVAVLTQTLRVVQLVIVLACPGLLGAATAMVAAHAHIFGVMSAKVVRACDCAFLVGYGHRSGTGRMMMGFELRRAQSRLVR